MSFFAPQPINQSSDVWCTTWIAAACYSMEEDRMPGDWTKSAIIRNRRQLHCNYKGLRVIRPSLYRYPGILTDCCVRFFLSHLRVSDDDDVRWFVIKTHSSKWVIQHGRHIGSGWFLPVAQNLIIPDFGPPPRTTTSFAKCWRKHLVGTCYWYNFEELLNCALFKII